jgi:hypothetical protein
MAIVTTNALLQGVRGTFGNTLVFKTMRGKTFVSAKARRPDKKKETAAQRNTRATFRQAAEWAQVTLLNPEKKFYYQQRAKTLKLPNAYTAAITDYMRKPKGTKVKQGDSIIYNVSKKGFDVKQVNVQLTDTNDIPIQQPKLVTSRHNDGWFVRYTPDDVVTPTLTLFITDGTGYQITFVDVPID